MAYTKLIPQHTKDGRVEEIARDSSHYLLSVQPGRADEYRLAQLDDYAKTPRRLFPHHAPIILSLSARASSESIPGTWGFGFWNYPFGMSLGFGGTGFRLPALPNAVWFFGASEENYLSFRDTRTPEEPRDYSERMEVETKRALQVKSPIPNSNSTGNRTSTASGATNAPLSDQRDEAANGFLAQSFRSPRFHPLLIPAGLALPISRKTTRRLLGKVVGEDGVRLNVDVTQWHRYRLDWRGTRVLFEVDDMLIFESQLSPNPPLGLVIWIDNQYAAFTPEGKIGFGVLENPEPAWLEVKDIDVTSGASNAG
jgi:hypothetical protein